MRCRWTNLVAQLSLRFVELPPRRTLRSYGLPLALFQIVGNVPPLFFQENRRSVFLPSGFSPHFLTPGLGIKIPGLLFSPPLLVFPCELSFLELAPPFFFLHDRHVIFSIIANDVSYISASSTSRLFWLRSRFKDLSIPRVLDIYCLLERLAYRCFRVPLFFACLLSGF